MARSVRQPEGGAAERAGGSAEAPRGALAVTLGYALLLALLWGFMYLDMIWKG